MADQLPVGVPSDGSFDTSCKKATKSEILDLFSALHLKKLSHSQSNIFLLNSFFFSEVEKMSDLVLSELYYVDRIFQDEKAKNPKNLVNQFRINSEIQSMISPKHKGTVNVLFYENANYMSAFTLIHHDTKQIIQFLPNGENDYFSKILKKTIALELKNKHETGYKTICLDGQILYASNESLRPFFITIALIDVVVNLLTTGDVDHHSIFQCPDFVPIDCSKRTKKRHIEKCIQEHLAKLCGRDFSSLLLSMKKHFIEVYPEYNFTFSSFDEQPSTSHSEPETCLNYMEYLDPTIISESVLQNIDTSQVASLAHNVQFPTTSKHDSYSAPPPKVDDFGENANVFDSLELVRNKQIICANSYSKVKLHLNRTDSLDAQDKLRNLLERHPNIAQLWAEREQERDRKFIVSNRQLFELQKILRRSKVEVPHIFKAKNFDKYLARKKKLFKNSKLINRRTNHEIKLLARTFDIKFG